MPFGHFDTPRVLPVESNQTSSVLISVRYKHTLAVISYQYTNMPDTIVLKSQKCICNAVVFNGNFKDFKV